MSNRFFFWHHRSAFYILLSWTLFALFSFEMGWTLQAVSLFEMGWTGLDSHIFH
jgi:hypothetical protein